MSRSRAIVALLALALAVPSVVFAQGAGDEQYQDPFGSPPAKSQGGKKKGTTGRAAQDDGGLSDAPPVDTGGNGGNGGNGNGSNGGDTGSGSGDTTPPADEPAAEPRGLPNTGSDPRILAFVGVLFVLVGVGLRLRTIDPDAY